MDTASYCHQDHQQPDFLFGHEIAESLESLPFA